MPKGVFTLKYKLCKLIFFGGYEHTMASFKLQRKILLSPRHLFSKTFDFTN